MTYRLRATALTNYVQVAREAGIDPYQQLADANIGRVALLDPGSMIPASAWRRLLNASALAAGLEDFGLRIAETRQITDLGPLGFAIKGEPTLRKALESMMRYLRLQSETVAMHMEEVAGRLLIKNSLLPPGAAPQRQSIELVVAGVYRLLRRFLGDAWKPRSICFSHPAPAGPTVHSRIFGRSVLFNQEFDGIVCLAAELEAPLPEYDPLMAQAVRQHLDSLLAESHLGFPEVVRRLIRASLPSGDCSADIVAGHLGVDRRTVHRRLHRDAQSYSGIYDEVRAEMASHYVRSGERSLAHLADLVGFGSASAFARWFNAKFGCTVSKWRQQQGLS